MHFKLEAFLASYKYQQPKKLYSEYGDYYQVQRKSLHTTPEVKTRIEKALHGRFR